MNIAQIIAIIQDNIAVVALSVILAQVLLLVLLLVITRSLSVQRKRYQQLTSGYDGKNLEQLLTQYATDVITTRREVADLSQELQSLALAQQSAYQKLGFIRYNAFPDVGGELSFSLVLLDNHNSGILLTSIYGREEARVYGKLINSGQSASSLSKEEQRALDQVIKTSR